MKSGSTPTPESATLRGRVERVTYHMEETGACILKVKPERGGELITVLGNAPRVVAGETVSAVGEWVQHAEYGRQFQAREITLSQPDSVAGLVHYLGSGLIDGIGPTYAQRMVDRFGQDVLRIIEHESARLEEVDGVGKKRRQEIRASWMKQKSVHDIMLFLHQHGISSARALRIYKTYGAEAVQVLQENPYRLAVDIHGVGFKTADEIASQLGVAAESPERLRAGLLHVLEQGAESGHCCMPADWLAQEAAHALQVAQGLVQAERENMTRQGTLSLDAIEGREMIYLPRLHHAELQVAQRLRALGQKSADYPELDVEKALDWTAGQTGRELAESQRQAVREAVTQRALIITGGPGVGKTTILNAILRILMAKKVQPVLAAPTGRAAQRLGESTGLTASTLHRLLEYQGEGRWGRGVERPLEGDLFVVDEVSMVDVSLMAHFLKALPPQAHLLLVGDADQLPSVGPGSVLQDVISSGTVPVVRLTEIFRQAASSRIITAAHAINKGQMPDLKPSAEADFFFLEKADAESISSTIVQLVQQRLSARYGFDPLRDIQVLCPMNQQALGTRVLNQRLQAALNPPQEMGYEVERFHQTFRAGDKVIQTRNDYEKEVFNGDIGYVRRVDSEPVQVTVEFEGGRTAHYEPGELDELRLAYAITIHKSQGSEFPCVIIPWSMAQFIMLERSLLYTAVTRGRKLVVIVGEARAIGHAVRETGSRHRWSGLVQRLRG